MLTIILKLLPHSTALISDVQTEAKELASTDDGQQKLTAALAFAKAVVTELEAALA